MLVVTRKEGEAILIPELGVTIRVVEIRGNRVRIGVEAPREATVIRDELLFDPEINKRRIEK